MNKFLLLLTSICFVTILQFTHPVFGAECQEGYCCYGRVYYDYSAPLCHNFSTYSYCTYTDMNDSISDCGFDSLFGLRDYPPTEGCGRVYQGDPYCYRVDASNCPNGNEFAYTSDGCAICKQVAGGWSEWGDCSNEACGGTETRTCTNPSPSCWGAGCTGPSSQPCGGGERGSPVAPTLISPIGSLLDPIASVPPVTLSWTSVSKADKYEVIVRNLDTGTTLWKSITATSVSVSLPYGNTFSWQVRGVNTTCGTENGAWSSLGYFMTDYVPTLEKIVLRNSSGAVVAPDSLGRNNICQEKFVYDPLPRRVRVEATIKDTDIAPDGVKNATLRWNGNLYPLPLSARSGDTWVGTITLDFPVSLGSIGPYNWELQASDLYVTSVWIDSNRAWKIWDCQVEVDGTLYDGSAGQACDNTGFTTVADEKLAFASLIYKDMSASDDVTMNVSLPANYGINDVIYGKNYLPLFNGGDVASPDGTIMGTGRFTRSIDLNTGTTTCATYLGSISQFNLEDLVSAYEDNPRAKVDFSFIRDQESWFQVVGAGVKAKNNIDSGVPVTANATIRALSIGGIRSDNGLISYGGTYTNINGYNDSSAYGIPNNWWVNRNTNDSTNYSYQYFYNNFYVNGGVGETGSTWGSSHPSEGVYFVNGDLNVDNDFTLDTDKYLIVIVRGKITIANNVNRLDGIYIADGNSTDISGIEAGGESDTALTINGLLYSRKAIRLHRTFINKRTNNSTPAVRVNYNPNIIFNMPGSLMRVLSGWREE